MIDLHLHTTASDGRLAPDALVARAAGLGLTTISVTDHDTTAGLTEAADAATRHSVRLVPGIEITAVEDGRDVHMLGYFIDTADPVLAGFLSAQRDVRVDRLRRIAGRLSELGLPVDVDAAIDAATQAGRTVGRPLIADAMIACGYVASRRDAFDRWLAGGRPAFLARDGASPQQVIDVVHGARGRISLAHPGRTGLADARLRRLVDAGLDAIEVYHSDHDAAAVTRYASLADDLGVLRTGGSDFHGDPNSPVMVGSSSLPTEHWARLRASVVPC